MVIQGDYDRLQKRVTDTVIHARCDRRTLATLATYFIKERGYVSSISNLVNSSLEMLKQILVRKDIIEEILSTEDAMRIMEGISSANLNPGGRNRKTLINQLEREDMYLEGVSLDYADHRKTKTMQESKPTMEHLLSDKEAVHDMAMDIARRVRKDREAKDQLKIMPDNVVKKGEE